MRMYVSPLLSIVTVIMYNFILLFLDLVYANILIWHKLSSGLRNIEAVLIPLAQPCYTLVLQVETWKHMVENTSQKTRHYRLLDP